MLLHQHVGKAIATPLHARRRGAQYGHWRLAELILRLAAAPYRTVRILTGGAFCAAVKACGRRVDDGPYTRKVLCLLRGRVRRPASCRIDRGEEGRLRDSRRRTQGPHCWATSVWRRRSPF